MSDEAPDPTDDKTRYYHVAYDSRIVQATEVYRTGKAVVLISGEDIVVKTAKEVYPTRKEAIIHAIAEAQKSSASKNATLQELMKELLKETSDHA